MSKVTITKIKECFQGKIQTEDLVIEWVKYLPFVKKKNLIETIIDNSIDDGLIDYSILELSKKMLIVREYTNIDFSTIDKAEGTKSTDKLVEMYDLLEESGIMDSIFEGINKKELSMINDLLKKQVAEMTRILDNASKNALLSSMYEVVCEKAIINFKEEILKSINTFLENSMKKMPDEKGMNKLVGEFSKLLKDADPNKFKFLKDVIGFNNGAKTDKVSKPKKNDVSNVLADKKEGRPSKADLKVVSKDGDK